MNEYKEYATKIEKIESTLVGMIWLKLTYIKTKSDSINKYVNYLSSKFFPNKKTIDQYAIEERLVVIESAIKWYEDLNYMIENDENITPNLKKFTINRLQENINKAKIAKKAIYFEAEKFGYDIIFEWSTFEIKKNKESIDKIWLWANFDERKKEYLKDIDILQTSVYWPKISEIKEEKNIIMSICNERFEKNKDKLSKEEQKIFEDFLNKFRENITFDNIGISKELPARWKLTIEEIMTGTEHVKKNFYPNINWWQTKEKWKVWYSATFQNKTREYPDKETDNFNKILTTIWHEDAWHMIRWNNQEINWLIIAWAWYEDIEEWITKLNEWLLKYGLYDFPLIPSNTFISVFIWENYNFEDTYRLIKIIEKISTNQNIDQNKENEISEFAIKLAERVKWYYPRDEKWSNRKDVIYFRGLRKILEYLKSLPNDKERAKWYKKAMSAKVSFKDIFLLDDIFDELWIVDDKINQNKLVDKIFNVKLEKWVWAFSKKKKINWKSNIEENLLEWDFRFDWMQEYCMQEKKALIALFDIVKYKKVKWKYVKYK